MPFKAISEEWTPTPGTDGWSEHNIYDDGNVQIDLPFVFNYYGNQYTTSWMHSNGVISFMSPSSTGSYCCSGYDIVQQIENGTYSDHPRFTNFIAVLQTDLIKIRNDAGFYTQSNEDSVKYFWKNISEYYNANSANTVGAEIFSDGAINLHHWLVSIGNRNVTVGLFGDDPASGQYEHLYYGTGTNLGTGGGEYIYGDTPTYDISLLCAADPLFNSACPGYAEAYAEYLYQQQCSANPLYDSGCPGYASAYYTQQCSLDPLYDSGCPGYDTAYFNQQCTLDPLYDTTCDGYEQAYYETYIAPELERQQAQASNTETTDTTGTSNTTSNNNQLVVSDPVESITNVQVTGDVFVDEILRDNTNNNTVDIVVPEIPTQSVVEDTGSQREQTTEESREEPETEMVASIEREVEDERETESSSNVDEQVEESGDGEVSEPEQSSDGETETDSGGKTESKKSDSKSDKKSKKEKVKELMIAKATNLANDMAAAATAEQQAMIQQQIMAVMAYVYGFNDYRTSMQGGYYPDTEFYNTTRLPENQRGLRNGLAQEILWDKMVEMQYNRK